MTQPKTNPEGIYAILEKLLRATKDNPLTCADLFDDPNVKKHADSPSRVSDYIAHMWRRGLLQRWTAPAQLDNKARYAYTWKDSPTNVKPMPDLQVLKNPLTKPNISVIENDNEIVLDFSDFTITVRSKKK